MSVMPAVSAHIFLRKLSTNYEVLCSLLQATAGAKMQLLAVVKGNAYGHGVIPCARALFYAGAEWLGVTDVAEGIAVRKALGESTRILVMRSSLAEGMHELLEAGLTPVLGSLEQIDSLQTVAFRMGLPVRSVRFHLEIDTGMTRQGIQPADLDELVKYLKNSEQLELEAVMTHFASAENVQSPQTTQQIEAFTSAVRRLISDDVHPAIIHAGNTSTIDAGVVLPELFQLANESNSHMMCRAGIGLYGYALKVHGAESRALNYLEPVLSLKTRILALQFVSPGTHVGYGGTFRAVSAMTLALLPIGYADGLRRELSNTGSVLISGRRARIVGRISMDMTIVDVTDIPGTKVGDEVIVIGESCSEKITAQDHAEIANTIPYEILCNISSRVPRFYFW